MAAATYQQLLGLIRAHAEHDDARFRRTVLQIAAHQKADGPRQELQRLAEREQTMLPLGTQNFVRSLPDATLDALVLPDDVRDLLLELASEFQRREVLRIRGLDPRSRLLFTGPHGSGKTTAASALARLANVSAYRLHVPSLVGSLMGETGRNLDGIFRILHLDCVLVVDEIDTLGHVRNDVKDSAGGERNAIVNTLLTAMDETQAGLLIATTNRADVLDPAFRDRFDEVVEFPGLTDAAATVLIEKLAKQYGLATVPWCTTARDRESFRALEKAVKRAARQEILAARAGQEILAARVSAPEESKPS